MIQISTKGFREAAAKLQAMANVGETARFREMLLDAMEPIRAGVIQNIHSVTGRTVQAVVKAPGHGRLPSAYVKVDKKIAFVLRRGKPYPYPYAVESGHGGPRPAPPHPFFRNAVESNRAGVRRLVNEGARQVLLPYIQSSQVGGEFI